MGLSLDRPLSLFGPKVKRGRFILAIFASAGPAAAQGVRPDRSEFAPPRVVLYSQGKTQEMESPDKSPILDPAEEPAGLVGGHDGQRSPLQPPLKNSIYDDNGQLKSERVKNPDGSENWKRYNDNGRLRYEGVNNPDGSNGWKGYDDDGRLEFEGIINPDGNERWKHYHRNGQLRYERVKNPDGSRVQKRYDDDGRLEFERITNPDGSETEKRYNLDGQPIEQADPA